MSDKSAQIAAHKAMRPGRWERAVARCAAGCAAGVDGMFGCLIVLVGIIGLSPLSAVAAARETIAARRARRARIAAAPSEIWARQARRNAALADRGFAMPQAPRPDL